MADKATYLQLLEHGQQIDFLLNSPEIEEDEKVYYFLLKDKRKVDYNIVNSMNRDDDIKIN